MNRNIWIRKWNKLNVIWYRHFLHVVGYSGDKTSRNLFRLFQLAIFFVGVVFLINLFAIGQSSFGEWGDFFGGVLNPLLTFLTFLGLLITIILQQKELKQSRKEFKGQKEALQNQEFDNKFFQMLNLLNNITEKLILKSESTEYQGKDIFTILKNTLQQHIENEGIMNPMNGKFLNFQNAFNKFNKQYDTTFKYYFINLYQVLKYIRTYSNSENEAKEYSNMLRAQLTRDELILLAYNAIGVQNFTTDDYQQLVETYSFFEHLRYDDFCHNPNIIQTVNTVLVKYSDKAFGKNQALIDAITQHR